MDAVPDFPHAACRGRGHLFDPRQPGEELFTPRGRTIARHQQAQQVCRTECEHLDECRLWGLLHHHDRKGEPGPIIGSLTTAQRRQIRADEGLPNPARTVWKIYECGHPDGPRDHKGRCAPCVRAYEEQRSKDWWAAGKRIPRPKRKAS